MELPTFTKTPLPEELADGAAQAKSRVAEFGEKAASAIEERMDSVARRMDSAAAKLRGHAGNLPGGRKVSGAAYATADAMEMAATYLDDRDLEEIAGDVKGIVKKHPGATLLTAAAVGFLIARAFSRD